MKSYTVTLTPGERAQVMFALGTVSGMFYDGTHRHGPDDNAHFKKIMALANKFAAAQEEDNAPADNRS